jgi:hypothetical protein
MKKPRPAGEVIVWCADLRRTRPSRVCTGNPEAFESGAYDHSKHTTMPPKTRQVGAHTGPYEETTHEPELARRYLESGPLGAAAPSGRIGGLRRPSSSGKGAVS